MGFPSMRMPSHLGEVSHRSQTYWRDEPVNEMGGGEGAVFHAGRAQGGGDVFADGALAIGAGDVDGSPGLGDWLAQLDGTLESGRRVHQDGGFEPTGDQSRG
jgi:hypothetical protein